MPCVSCKITNSRAVFFAHNLGKNVHAKRVLPAEQKHEILSMVFSQERASKSRGLSPGIFFISQGELVLEISLFADESGESGTESKYYLLTLVFHEQDNSISRPIELYENDICTKGLPNIPLHTSPLMNGHDEYAGMDIQDRKRLLQAFFTMFQHLPIKYHTFSYRKSEFTSDAALEVPSCRQRHSTNHR